MNKLVMNFLVTEGYVEAAEKFRMESGTERILILLLHWFYLYFGIEIPFNWPHTFENLILLMDN